jgi:hypothetical protein
MLTEGTSADELAAQSCPPGSLLRMLASQLISHDLRVREHVRGGELTEIEATNPRDPQQSRVIIGCDGFLTWERWCRFRTDQDAQAVTHTIVTLLD